MQEQAICALPKNVKDRFITLLMAMNSWNGVKLSQGEQDYGLAMQLDNAFAEINYRQTGDRGWINNEFILNKTKYLLNLYILANDVDKNKAWNFSSLASVTEILNRCSDQQKSNFIISVQQEFQKNGLQRYFNFAINTIRNNHVLDANEELNLPPELKPESNCSPVTSFFFGNTKRQLLTLLGAEAIIIGATELAAICNGSDTAAYALSSVKLTSVEDFLASPYMAYIGAVVLFGVCKVVGSMRQAESEPNVLAPDNDNGVTV